MLTGRCRRTTKSLGLTVVGLMPTTRNISMLVAAAVIALGGCVSFTTTLIDRRAGDWQTCESSGWGTVGVRRAALRNAMCVETFKTLGYYETSDAPPSPRTAERPGVDAGEAP